MANFKFSYAKKLDLAGSLLIAKTSGSSTIGIKFCATKLVDKKRLKKIITDFKLSMKYRFIADIKNDYYWF